MDGQSIMKNAQRILLIIILKPFFLVNEQIENVINKTDRIDR